MELKYPIFVIIGAALCVIMVILSFVHLKRDKFKGGKKIMTPSYLEDDPYFKRKKIEYRILSGLLAFFCGASILTASWVLAGPFRRVVETQDKYCRDIILCMDVSTSVDDLNRKLVTDLKDLVVELKGERIGIVIFNTSSVLLCPLTDDYDFILDQLETIRIGLEKRNNIGSIFGGTDDYYYYTNYIEAGTLVGCEERGSSLIADGLASCINNFSDWAEDRTRVIIFSTDNELAGSPLLTMDQAAQLCKLRGATVYGIGTKWMSNANRREMEMTVKKTGGDFFLEEDAATFSTIIDRIALATENLVAGKKVIHKESAAGPAIICLILSTLSMLGLIKLLRR